MKFSTTSSLFILLFAAGMNAAAQSSVSSAGGRASGTGGSSVYNVGQAVYTTASGTGGIVNTGVHQPFLIWVLISVEEASEIDLAGSVYPNPAADFLCITIKKTTLRDLSFKLFDFRGKLLMEDRIEEPETTVSMQGISPGTYIMKILSVKAEVKTFKIIKK